MAVSAKAGYGIAWDCLLDQVIKNWIFDSSWQQHGRIVDCCGAVINKNWKLMNSIGMISTRNSNRSSLGAPLKFLTPFFECFQYFYSGVLAFHAQKNFWCEQMALSCHSAKIQDCYISCGAIYLDRITAGLLSFGAFVISPSPFMHFKIILVRLFRGTPGLSF